MPPDNDADDRAAPVAPDAVARTTFPTSFRGYDPDHVRVFLEKIADELRAARDREAALRAKVEAAEARAEAAAHPTEAQLTAALGEETARVLLAAREASTEIRAKGEESVARLLREAQDEATRMKSQAETILVRRTQEAEAAAAEVLAAAEAAAAFATAEAEGAIVQLLTAGEEAKEAARREVRQIHEGAAAQAEDTLETARAQGKEMVDEALLVRTRVLDDLSRKRKAARVQLERLQAGRDRLMESYDIVRRTLDEATNELKGSLTAAKRAADAAARRVEVEPAPSVAELEAEVDAARDAGLPLVEEESELDAEFTEELPEGEMVAIEPSAAFEEVRVIEPEPEPERVIVDAVEVVEVIEVADEVVVVVDEVVVVEELDDETEAVDVDDLFARIRAARATEVAKAHEVLAQDSPAVPTDAAVESQSKEAPTVEEFTPTPVAPDDQALLERRDAATEAAEQKATRKLKRVLADEQNEVLDRLRRDGKAKVGDLLPSAKEHADRYASAAAPALAEAANAGAAFYDKAGSANSVDDLAKDLGEALAAPLRERVSASLREAAGDDDALADGVRAAYRDWKAHRIGMQTRDTVFAAFNRGLFDATPAATTLRWLVDDGGSPCPDAEDNSLAGLVVRGDPYPTGHCYPPAHPGCRCLLVPTPN